MIHANFNPFPILKSERLILRQITYNDVDFILKLRSNLDVMRYVNRPLISNKEEAAELIGIITSNIEENKGINWGISFKDNDELIGIIGLWRLIPEHDRAEIGYMLYPDFHGLGLMTEALQTTMEYGFDTLKLHSVEAWIHPENMASQKLIKKYGFKQEAHFRDDHFFNGQYHDSLVFVKLIGD